MFAWIMGWLLVLEYGVSAATVAAGWSGNLTGLLANFGLQIPVEWTTSYSHAGVGAGGATIFSGGHGLNLLGAGGILGVTALLVIGISESASVNNVIVVVKVGVLLVFVTMGVAFIHPASWHPFFPKDEGGLKSP